MRHLRVVAIALVLVLVLPSCQSLVPMIMEPFEDPTEAPRGEISVTHPEGVCSLCDLYYDARQSVIRIEAPTAH